MPPGDKPCSFFRPQLFKTLLIALRIVIFPRSSALSIRGVRYGGAALFLVPHRSSTLLGGYFELGLWEVPPPPPQL